MLFWVMVSSLVKRLSMREVIFSKISWFSLRWRSNLSRSSSGDIIFDFFEADIVGDGSKELDPRLREVGVGNLQLILVLGFEVLGEVFGAGNENSEATLLDKDARGTLIGSGEGEPIL